MQSRTPSELRSAEKIIGIPLLPQTAEFDPTHFAYMFPRRYEILSRIINGQIDTDDFARQKKILTGLVQMEGYTAAHLNGDASFFRGRQVNVFDDTRRHLDAGFNYGYVKLPCSSGKTVLYIKTMEVTGFRGIVAVPTKELINQTLIELNLHAPHLDSGCYYSDKRKPGKDVIVTTHASLPNVIRKFGKNYEAVFLDEAHEMLSINRQKYVNEKLKPHYIVLGYTATDTYYENKTLRDLLGNPFHTMSVREGVQESLLCPFDVVLVETGVDLSGVHVQQGDFSTRQVEYAIQTAGIIESAAELYCGSFKGEKALFPCSGVQSSIDMAEALKKRGVKAESFTHKNTTSERREIWKDYKAGKVQVLTGKNLLLRGVSDVETALTMNIGMTMSAVVSEQRAGRVLRINPSNPNKIATIVEFTPSEFSPSRMPLTFSEVIDGAVKLRQFPDAINSTGQTRSRVSVKGIKVHYEESEILHVLGVKKQKAGYGAHLGGKLVSYEEQKLLAGELKKRYQNFRKAFTNNELYSGGLDIFKRRGPGQASWYERLLELKDNISDKGLVRRLDYHNEKLKPVAAYLAEKFLPLAKEIARYCSSAIPLSERKSIAAEALLEGVYCFATSKNARLESFLVNHIKQALRTAADNMVVSRPLRSKELNAGDVTIKDVLANEEFEQRAVHLYAALAEANNLDMQLIIRHLLEGVKTDQLAEEFGYSRSYPLIRISQAISKATIHNQQLFMESDGLYSNPGKTANSIKITTGLDLCEREFEPFIVPEFVSLRLLLSPNSIKKLERYVSDLKEPYASIFRERFMFQGERPSLESLFATKEMESKAVRAVKLRKAWLELDDPPAETWRDLNRFKKRGEMDLSLEIFDIAGIKPSGAYTISEVMKILLGKGVGWRLSEIPPLDSFLKPQDLKSLELMDRARSRRKFLEGILGLREMSFSIDQINETSLINLAACALFIESKFRPGKKVGISLPGKMSNSPLAELEIYGVNLSALVRYSRFLLPQDVALKEIVAGNEYNEWMAQLWQLPSTLGTATTNFVNTGKVEGLFSRDDVENSFIAAVGATPVYQEDFTNFSLNLQHAPMWIRLLTENISWSGLGFVLKEGKITYEALLKYLEKCTKPDLVECFELLRSKSDKYITAKQIQALKSEFYMP